MANIEAGRRATPTRCSCGGHLEAVVATAVSPGDRGRPVRTRPPCQRRAPVSRSQSCPPGRADDRSSAPRRTVEHPRQLDALTASYVERRRRGGTANVPPPLPGFGGADLAPSNFYSFGPGRSYRFANMGVSLAAFLVEAAAGIGFDTRASGGSSRLSASIVPGGAWPDSHGERSRCSRGGRGTRTPTADGRYGYPDYRTAPSGDGPAARSPFRDGHGRGLVAWPPTPVRGHVRELPQIQVQDLEPGQGLIWFELQRADRAIFRHDGGAPVSPPSASSIPDDVGVVALAEGGWRPSRGITRCSGHRPPLRGGSPARLSEPRRSAARSRADERPPREDGNKFSDRAPWNSWSDCSANDRSSPMGRAAVPLLELVPGREKRSATAISTDYQPSQPPRGRSCGRRWCHIWRDLARQFQPLHIRSSEGGETLLQGLRDTTTTAQGRLHPSDSVPNIARRHHSQSRSSVVSSLLPPAGVVGGGIFGARSAASSEVVTGSRTTVHRSVTETQRALAEQLRQHHVDVAGQARHSVTFITTLLRAVASAGAPATADPRTPPRPPP